MNNIALGFFVSLLIVMVMISQNKAGFFSYLFSFISFILGLYLEDNEEVFK